MDGAILTTSPAAVTLVNLFAHSWTPEQIECLEPIKIGQIRCISHAALASIRKNAIPRKSFDIALTLLI